MEIFFHRGEGKRPLVVFIHGMGMDMKTWSSPSAALILGGKYPLPALAGPDAEIATSLQDLKSLGYPLLSWTQSRPVGPVMVAVRELKELLCRYEKYAARGTILICHSRGGLVARKYLEAPDVPIRAVSTLATPHHGTSMAKWAAIISPLASAMNQLLRDAAKKDIDSAFRRVLGFLGSTGLRELLPGSQFYSGLKDVKKEGVRYVSMGDTNPDLLRAVSVSLPRLISRVLPKNVIPEEMKEGMGDGLVSAASSVLPYADEHLNVNVNHGSILFDKEVRRLIIKTVELV
jgi:pimeloyl-ACP methyl ester carboxylesterase